jgi:polar amino acid transport system substrate-binding protein
MQMKLSKQLLFAALAALGVSATVAKADLKFGVDASPYPPFTSQNAAGEWEGWEYDIMQALCAELGETKCSFEPVAWDGIIPALQAKKFDAIMSSMSITDKRKQQIDFSDMYYQSGSVIIGAKNGDMDFTPEHLAGKTIGAEASTTHANYAEKYYASKGATIKTYAGQDEANADLVAGRLDYIEADAVTLMAFLASDDGKACCELKGMVPTDPVILGAGVGLGIRKEDTAFRDKVNAAFKSLSAKGVFEATTKKWGLEGKLQLPAK